MTQCAHLTDVLHLTERGDLVCMPNGGGIAGAVMVALGLLILARCAVRRRVVRSHPLAEAGSA